MNQTHHHICTCAEGEEDHGPSDKTVATFSVPIAIDYPAKGLWSTRGFMFLAEIQHDVRQAPDHALAPHQGKESKDKVRELQVRMIGRRGLEG